MPSILILPVAFSTMLWTKAAFRTGDLGEEGSAVGLQLEVLQEEVSIDLAPSLAL